MKADRGQKSRNIFDGENYSARLAGDWPDRASREERRGREIHCLARYLLQALKQKTERPASWEAGRFRLNPKVLFGGAREDRTPDLLNAIQALSHLSYDPTGEKHRAVSAAMPAI